MPGPTFVNTGARSTDTNTTITPVLPGSRVNNNLLIAWADVFGSQSGTWSLDAASVTNGWTIFASINQGSQRPMALAWRLVTGTEAAPKFNFTTTAIIEAQVRQYTGDYTTSPIGNVASNSAGASVSITCPAIVTTAANSLAVNIATTGNTGSGNIPVPSSYTAEDALNSNYSAADLAIATAGTSSGATSVTYTSSNYRVFTFEIRSTAPPTAGAGEADGAASVSGVGRALFSAVGNADGAASVAGVGGASDTATGEADGVASVGAPGQAVTQAVGNADGVASVSGGGGVTSAPGHADGIATVIGIGRKGRLGAGTANGVASVSGTGLAAYFGRGNADGVASATGTPPGPSVGHADGVASVSGVGIWRNAAVGNADGSAFVLGSASPAGPFYFAWANSSETTFGPQHLRVDEQIFEFDLGQEEGQSATLQLTMQNPFVGLLASDRQQWAWFAWDSAGAGLGIIPRFFGRLIALPSDLDGETITLHFIGMPLDLIERKRAAAAPLMVLPYYDPVFIEPSRRLDPDALLESYSGLWDIDPVTHNVTFNDFIVGADGEVEFQETDALYHSVKVAIDKAPLKNVLLYGTVKWEQFATGVIDTGNKIFSSLNAGGMISAWPKAQTDLGSGWSVAHSLVRDNVPQWTQVSWSWSFENNDKTHNNGDTLTASESWSGPSCIQFPGGGAFEFVLPGTQLGNLYITTNSGYSIPGDEEDGTPGSSQFTTTGFIVTGWQVRASLSVRYEAKRQRTEQVRFTLAANLQPVFTDPGDVAATFAQDSELIQVDGKVAGETPYGNFRGEWTPNTTYSLFDLFTTGNGTFGWQVLRDHISLDSFDFEATASRWEPNTYYDAGTNVFVESLGEYFQVLISGFSGPTFGSLLFIAVDPWFGLAVYARITDPHAGPRLYQNIPNMRGDYRAGATYVPGNMVIAPSLTWYSVNIGHVAAATFNQFAIDATGALLYAPLLNPTPIGDISRRSYFPTDRGNQSIQHLILRARAHIAQRARVAQVSFDVPFAKAINISCRLNARLYDRRLPGGSALGKVTSYHLTGNGDQGLFLGHLTLGCTAGFANAIAPVAGVPEYADDDYVDDDYQFHSSAFVALPASDVAYSPPIDAVTDDGLVFPLDARQAIAGQAVYSYSTANNGVPSFTVSGTQPNPTLGFGEIPGAADLQKRAQMQEELITNAAKLTETVYSLALRPVQNGPFSALYDLTLTELEVPKQIDLSSSSGAGRADGVATIMGMAA